MENMILNKMVHTILYLLLDAYCEEDWISYNDYCYYLSDATDTQSWNQASGICVDMNAFLSSIEGPEENDFLTERSINSLRVGIIKT